MFSREGAVESSSSPSSVDDASTSVDPVKTKKTTEPRSPTSPLSRISSNSHDHHRPASPVAVGGRTSYRAPEFGELFENETLLTTEVQNNLPPLSTGRNKPRSASTNSGSSRDTGFWSIFQRSHSPAPIMAGLTFQLQSGLFRETISLQTQEVAIKELREIAARFIKKYVSFGTS